MNVLLVHAHPEPQSFNGALRDLAVEVLTGAGHEVRVSDLYAMGFNPVAGRHDFLEVARPELFHLQTEQRHAHATGTFAPDVRAEQEKLLGCDFLILQFPMWWTGIPAILKGWFDRVLAAGFAYGGERWFDQGVFRGKRALLSITTGGPSTMFESDGIHGDLLGQLYHPVVHGTLNFVGFDVLPPFVAWGAAHAGDEGRQAYLEEYRQRLLRLEDTEPIPFRPVADYDEETLRLKRA